jgi:hypothetical protein
MRTNYIFFSEQPGFVTNILYYDNRWKKPSNFIISEILFFLAMHRKERGPLGIEGYFSLRGIANALQRFGFDPEDIFSAANYLLHHNLVAADHMNTQAVVPDDCIKISASGFIHLRVLAERLEYLYGILPVVAVSDHGVADVFADAILRENRAGGISLASKAASVVALNNYLRSAAEKEAKYSGIILDLNDKTSGTSYVLRQVQSAVENYKKVPRTFSGPNLLDD